MSRPMLQSFDAPVAVPANPGLRSPLPHRETPTARHGDKWGAEDSLITDGLITDHSPQASSPNAPDRPRTTGPCLHAISRSKRELKPFNQGPAPSSGRPVIPASRRSPRLARRLTRPPAFPPSLSASPRLRVKLVPGGIA